MTTQSVSLEINPRDQTEFCFLPSFMIKEHTAFTNKKNYTDKVKMKTRES